MCQLDSPVEFGALPRDRHLALAARALSLLLPATLAFALGGSGLMITLCSTKQIAARLRSVPHDSHASRTRSDGGMSLMTVADPVSRSYSRRAALMSSEVEDPLEVVDVLAQHLQRRRGSLAVGDAVVSPFQRGDGHVG
jgi:hypothetical protein